MLHALANHQDVSRFSEQSHGRSNLDIEITQYDRQWFERFRRYKFWYTLRMNFVNTVDSLLYVNELLNVHSDAMECVFMVALQTIIDGIQLQHFQGENHVLPTDFVQVTLEHADFVNYIFSSILVKYSDFQFHKVIGGIMNWLQNLAQSNKRINVSNDWMMTLDVSRTNDVQRGMGKKRREGEIDSCVPIKLSKNIIDGIDELS